MVATLDPTFIFHPYCIYTYIAIYIYIYFLNEELFIESPITVPGHKAAKGN